MKSFYLIVMLFIGYSFVFAQTTVNGNSASQQDSIKIADLVQKQIQAARQKDSIKAVAPAPLRFAKQLKYVPESKPGIQTIVETDYFGFLGEINTKVLILVLFSIVMFIWVFSRRYLIYSKSREKSKLKRNIMMLREEKVPQKIKKAGKNKSRVLLKHFNGTTLNDKVLAIKARELNLPQGELLLASRIKNFELGK